MTAGRITLTSPQPQAPQGWREQREDHRQSRHTAHVDVDGDGDYYFMPPDIAIDLPASTADGAIAVVGAEVTIGG